MRHKSTVVNLDYHNQFEGTKEDIKLQKQTLKERAGVKDLKEGQSDYRVKKQMQKKG
jgi:hypothetical protein